MSKYKYFDCHSHPHDARYESENINTDIFLQKLKDDGAGTVAIGTDYANTEKAINLALKWDHVYVSIGIHPADNHLEIFSKEKFEQFLNLGNGKVVGVGECGLDYFYFDKTDWEKLERSESVEIQRQKDLFNSQIDFAIEKDLPLILHGRPRKNSMDAYRDILDILESRRVEAEAKGEAFRLRGHAHFFVGNSEIAERFLKLNFLLSFDGPITFTTEYDTVIKNTPLESIMIETDSPYASPALYRGKINYPHYVIEVAKKISELKEISLEKVLEVTTENAVKLFRL